MDTESLNKQLMSSTMAANICESSDGPDALTCKDPSSESPSENLAGDSSCSHGVVCPVRMSLAVDVRANIEQLNQGSLPSFRDSAKSSKSSTT